MAPRSRLACLVQEPVLQFLIVGEHAGKELEIRPPEHPSTIEVSTHLLHREDERLERLEVGRVRHPNCTDPAVRGATVGTEVLAVFVLSPGLVRRGSAISAHRSARAFRTLADFRARSMKYALRAWSARRSLSASGRIRSGST